MTRTDANLGHQYSGTSHLEVVIGCSSICKYRLRGVEPRDGQLSRQMKAHLFGELGKWRSMDKCDQGGTVRSVILWSHLIHN